MMIRIGFKSLGLASLLLCGLAACVSEKIPIQSLQRADTLKIAVLPLNYAGFEATEARSYGSGIRSILAAYLDAHPNLLVFDRAKIKQQIQLAQTAAFNGQNLPLPTLAGADYLLMGSYQVKSPQVFRGLELRLIDVKTGLLVAQQHRAETELNAYELGTFLNQFGEQVRQQLHLPPFENAGGFFPCRNSGWRSFLDGESAWDMAQSLENPRQRLQKLDEALQQLRRSESAFCSLGKPFIENEIQALQIEKDLVQGF